jgi:MFS family permease
MPFKQRHRVLGLLFVLAVITYVDRVCISVAGKAIQEELGLTPSQWGWVLGAFALAYGIFEIPSGALGDRLGPRRVLTRIVAWWSGFTALTGLAQSFWQLVTVRFLFGAGEAGAFPNIAATIARWFPFAERARAQGFVWMASRVGGAITPALVIPIQLQFGWRACFYIFGAVGIVWAAVWYAWFRDDPKERSGITPAELDELGPDRIVNVGHGLPWRRVLREANLWWLMLMYCLYCWTSFFYLSWLHTFLENGRGYSKADLVAWSWLPFVFGGCANLLGGVVSDWLVRRIGLKWGRRALGCGGMVCAAIFTGAACFTQDKFLTVLFLAIGYAGSDVMLPVAWAVCLDVGGRHSGSVSGAMNMAGQVGSFSSTVAFGYIVSATGSWDAPLIPMSVIALVSALLWLKIDATRTLAGAPPASPTSLT